MSTEAKNKLEERLKYCKLQRTNLHSRMEKTHELKKKLKKTDSEQDRKKIKETLKMLDEIDDKEIDATMRGGDVDVMCD
jgi:hypothetical protein